MPEHERPPADDRGKATAYCRGDSFGSQHENLKARLKKVGVNFPLEISKALRSVASWSTDMRYDVGHGSYVDAKAFQDSVAQVIRWVEKSL